MTTKDLHPGLGSGALREALDIGDELNQCLQIIVTNAGNIKDRYGAGSFTRKDAAAIEKAVDRAAKAVRALSLSSPIEPNMQGLRYEKIESNGAVVGFNLWVLGLSMGYYGIDSPHGRELAKLAARPTAQASSEVRAKMMASFDKVIPSVETRVQIVNCILRALKS